MFKSFKLGDKSKAGTADSLVFRKKSESTKRFSASEEPAASRQSSLDQSEVKNFNVLKKALSDRSVQSSSSLVDKPKRLKDVEEEATDSFEKGDTITEDSLSIDQLKSLSLDLPPEVAKSQPLLETDINSPGVDGKNESKTEQRFKRTLSFIQEMRKNQQAAKQAKQERKNVENFSKKLPAEIAQDEAPQGVPEIALPKAKEETKKSIKLKVDVEAIEAGLKVKEKTSINRNKITRD